MKSEKFSEIKNKNEIKYGKKQKEKISSRQLFEKDFFANKNNRFGFYFHAYLTLLFISI